MAEGSVDYVDLLSSDTDADTDADDSMQDEQQEQRHTQQRHQAQQQQQQQQQQKQMPAGMQQDNTAAAAAEPYSPPGKRQRLEGLRPKLGQQHRPNSGMRAAAPGTAAAAAAAAAAGGGGDPTADDSTISSATKRGRRASFLQAAAAIRSAEAGQDLDRLLDHPQQQQQRRSLSEGVSSASRAATAAAAAARGGGSSLGAAASSQAAAGPTITPPSAAAAGGFGGVGSSADGSGRELAAEAVAIAARAAAAAAEAAGAAGAAAGLAGRALNGDRQQQQQQWQQGGQGVWPGGVGGGFPPQQQQQQQQQEDEELQMPHAAAAGAVDGVLGQPAVAQPTVNLDTQYLVWPELDSSPDDGPDFDLVPPSHCLPGVQPCLQLLISATQRPDSSSGSGKRKAAEASGGGRGRGGRRGGGRLPKGGAGRGGRGQRGRGWGGDSATAAAAAEAAQRLSAGFAAAAAGAADVSGGDWDGSCLADSGDAAADAGSHSAAAAAAAGDGEEWCGDWSGLDWDPEGYSSAADGGGGGGAAAAGVDEEASWYAAAAAKEQHYSWSDAPRGRFYSVQYAKQQARVGYAKLFPEQLVTRHNFRDELWQMQNRTRVVPITDPCHPCLHNSIRPATMPPSQQLKLEARRDLPDGCLLGLYWGKVLTLQEDEVMSAADLTCRHGLAHAYNMTAGCTESANLVHPTDNTPLEVMVMGDSQRCRLCLINDVKSWATDMEEVEGWGPCPQAERGTCNCDSYKVDTPEEAAAFINVRWKHYVYLSLSGDYIPAIAAFTSKPVAEGRELLADYEEKSKGFWQAMRSNLAQHWYVHTATQGLKDQLSGHRQVLALLPEDSPHQRVQQARQVALNHIRAGEQIEADMGVLLQEARARKLGARMPAVVAQARRRVVLAAAAGDAG